MLLLLACTQPEKPADDTASTGTDDTGDSAVDTDTDTADPYADLWQEVGQSMRSTVRSSNATGAVIAVWKEGEIIYEEAFGTRDPGSGDPTLTTTLFQIGSDTKKMTALLVLREVDAGRLSLDDTLADAVPELSFSSDAALASDLTLHELLSHQSGLYDYTPWVDAPEDSDLRDRALGRFAENEYAAGPSGVYWSYSNPNFSLLGLVVEESTGRAYGDVLTEDLFTPLGLTRTFARQADAVADGDYAVGTGIAFDGGYDTFDVLEDPAYTFGTVEIEDTLDCGFTRPAGLVWSTASDMARFGGFLIDGDASVLDPTLLAELETPHVPLYPGVDASALGYGYGLFITGDGWNGYEGWHPGVPLWSHGGNTMSMTSTFYLLPEQRIAVAILSNGYGDDFVEPVVLAMEGLTDLPTDKTSPSLLPEATDQPELAGTWYDGNALGTLEVTWDGDSLAVEAPDLEAAGYTVGSGLTPIAADYYVMRVEGVDYDLAHYTDEDGNEYLVNRAFVFSRDPTKVLAHPPVLPGRGLPEVPRGWRGR